MLRPASRPQHPAPEYLTFGNPELQVGFHLDSGATTPLATPVRVSSSSRNGPEGDAGVVGSATQGEEPTGAPRPRTRTLPCYRPSPPPSFLILEESEGSGRSLPLRLHLWRRPCKKEVSVSDARDPLPSRLRFCFLAGTH